MNCPQCGLYLPDSSVERCPRCGWARAASTSAGAPSSDYNRWGNPGATPAPAETPSPYGPSQSAPASGWPAYMPNTTPASPFPPAQQFSPDSASPYGQGFQPGAAPYGQPAQPSTPMYGQYAPPSVPMYGQYGQYAPPSMPMYGQAAPPSMGQPPAWGAPYAPQQPPKQSKTGLIVALVLVLVLLLGAGGGFFVLRNGQQGTQTGNTGGTATATAPAATATTASNTLFQDSFNDSSSGWSNDSHCAYASDGYHIKDGYICFAPAGSFSDAKVTVTAKQLSGSTQEGFGIGFRISSQTYYEFDIDSSGEWAVGKCGASTCAPLVDFTSSSAVHSGLNTANTLTVTMKGTHFVFSVNGTQVGDATDSAYANGKIGISAGQGTEIVYSNFAIASV
ncbi:MAG: family 16 glycoside hydrolase [Ktedonobacterales bacterium]